MLRRDCPEGTASITNRVHTPVYDPPVLAVDCQSAICLRNQELVLSGAAVAGYKIDSAVVGLIVILAPHLKIARKLIRQHIEDAPRRYLTDLSHSHSIAPSLQA
jgi:hypothetical protein